jgi:hypothetical protein
MDGVRVGRYDDLAAGIRGAPLSRRATAGLRFVQDPSAVTARKGRGVIGAVVVHHDHFARTREILVVQGFQGRGIRLRCSVRWVREFLDIGYTRFGERQYAC